MCSLFFNLPLFIKRLQLVDYDNGISPTRTLLKFLAELIKDSFSKKNKTINLIATLLLIIGLKVVDQLNDSYNSAITSVNIQLVENGLAIPSIESKDLGYQTSLNKIEKNGRVHFSTEIKVVTQKKKSYVHI